MVRLTTMTTKWPHSNSISDRQRWRARVGIAGAAATLLALGACGSAGPIDIASVAGESAEPTAAVATTAPLAAAVPSTAPELASAASQAQTDSIDETVTKAVAISFDAELTDQAANAATDAANAAADAANDHAITPSETTDADGNPVTEFTTESLQAGWTFDAALDPASGGTFDVISPSGTTLVTGQTSAEFVVAEAGVHTIVVTGDMDNTGLSFGASAPSGGPGGEATSDTGARQRSDQAPRGPAPLGSMPIQGGGFNSDGDQVLIGVAEGTVIDIVITSSTGVTFDIVGPDGETVSFPSTGSFVASETGDYTIVIPDEPEMGPGLRSTDPLWSLTISVNGELLMSTNAPSVAPGNGPSTVSGA